MQTIRLNYVKIQAMSGALIRWRKAVFLSNPQNHNAEMLVDDKGNFFSLSIF